MARRAPVDPVLVATGAQPISAVQWWPRDRLRANSYNPNHVAPPELALLRHSILACGWTQPIVVRPDGEIIDGYHRWRVSEDHAVAELTAGLVPVVVLDADYATMRYATIRHNRARGVHGVLKMADILAELDAAGVGPGTIGAELGMEPEEVTRLLERGKMTERGRADQLGEGWRPAPPKEAG